MCFLTGKNQQYRLYMKLEKFNSNIIKFIFVQSKTEVVILNQRGYFKNNPRIIKSQNEHT